MRSRTTVGAAKELCMSQPAVSHAIKRAESQLGFRLFDRVNNRLVPTEEARILFEESEPLFAIHQGIKQKANDLREGRSGRLRLVATSDLSESFLPGIFERFVAQHPKVKIAFDTLRLDSALEAVEMGLADLGFAIEPYPRPTLTYDPLVEIGMVCAFSPGSPLEKLRVVTPTDLDDQRLIFVRTTSRMNILVEDAFRSANARFAPAIEVRFLNIAARLAQAGLGVAVVDELTIASGLYSRLVTRPFEPHVGIMVNAVYAKDAPLQRLAGIFLEHARAEVLAIRAPAPRPLRQSKA